MEWQKSPALVRGDEVADPGSLLPHTAAAVTGGDDDEAAAVYNQEQHF